MEKQEFVSIKKLAEILPVSASLLYKRSENRQIPHYRIGSRLLFNPVEVMAAMKCDVEQPGDRQLANQLSEPNHDP